MSTDAPTTAESPLPPSTQAKRQELANEVAQTLEQQMPADPGSTQAKIGDKTLEMALNIGRVRRGKQHGHDLGDLDGGPVTRLFMEPLLMAEVIWAVYDDRLLSLGFENDDQFFEAIDANTRRNLIESFRSAILDFFPWAPAIVHALEKELGNLASLMDTVDPAMLIAQQVSGQLSNQQQESPGSTPAT